MLSLLKKHFFQMVVIEDMNSSTSCRIEISAEMKCQPICKEFFTEPKWKWILGHRNSTITLSSDSFFAPWTDRVDNTIWQKIIVKNFQKFSFIFPNKYKCHISLESKKTKILVTYKKFVINLQWQQPMSQILELGAFNITDVFDMLWFVINICFHLLLLYMCIDWHWDPI